MNLQSIYDDKSTPLTLNEQAELYSNNNGLSGRIIMFYLMPVIALLLIVWLPTLASWPVTIIMTLLWISTFIILYMYTYGRWRMYFLIKEVRNSVIKEPRLYTQDDMMRLDSSNPSGSEVRDWTLASGSYHLISLQDPESTTIDKEPVEVQLIFTSVINRPMGSFWTKPRSLLCNVTGYSTNFNIQEGLVSETGKCYWIERWIGNKVVLVTGRWTDYDEFMGQYIDNNGNMGSYPTVKRQTIKVVDLSLSPTAISADRSMVFSDDNYINFGVEK